MAFTLKRFLAWTAVGFAALTAAWIGTLSSTEFRAGRTEVGALRWRAQRLGAAIHAMQLRDSITTALRAVKPGSAMTVVLPNTGRLREREAVERTVREYWAGVVRVPAPYPTAFVFVDERPSRMRRAQATAVAGSPLSFVLLPWETDGRTCVVVVSSAGAGHPWQATRERQPGYEWLIRRLDMNVGACVRYARYGEPGAEIRRWLESENWHPAAAVTSIARRADRANPGAGVTPVGSAQQLTPDVVFGDWYGRWRLGTDAFACISGRESACATLLRSGNPIATSDRFAPLPSGIVRLTMSYSYTSWNRQLVAAIEDALGPERFAAFWTSRESPENALRSAAGVPIAGFLRAQIVTPLSPPVPSPWPTPFAWLLNIAAITLIIGLMVFANRRRSINV